MTTADAVDRRWASAVDLAPSASAAGSALLAGLELTH